MALPILNGRVASTRIELFMLLLASLATVAVLTLGLVSGFAGHSALPNLKSILLALLVAGAAVLSALVLNRTLQHARRRSRAAEAETRDLRRRLVTAEALISAEPQVVLYWEQGRQLSVIIHTLAGVPGLPTSQAELARFGYWLDAKSAANLKTALDRLFTDGRAFNLIVRTAAGGHVEADGRAAGPRAVLRFRDVAGYKRDLSAILDQHTGFAREIRASRALLNALPHPAWLRDQDGRLTWVNDAYVKAVESANGTEVLEGQIELLESRQRKATQRALKEGRTFHDRLPLIASGERRAHDVTVLPLGDATAGVALDAAEIETAKGELARQITAYDRTLDRVATAVSIVNSEQRLVFFNDAYRKLWQLDAEWLGAEPTLGGVLDRLRDLGRLPEVVNYRDWKEKLVAAHTAGTGLDDWWHLPDGRVIHVIGEPRPDGGMTYLHADESERLALESRYNALIEAQSETLNGLKEGVAVFATDGRLRLFNASLASIWKLSRRQLAERPHIDELIRDARVLHDQPQVWAEIANAVTSFSERREPLEGQMVRPDASVIDYAAAPLPDGGTLLTFADVTDSKRYERALVERNEALEAAARLKNQFIGHVSYELRTPLTNIIGFTELLANPAFGPLSAKQREYLDDLSSSSNTLLAIIDDILVLATMDAGALELKPAVVDVRAVIDKAILGIRDRAARARLTLDIAVSDDAVSFVADEHRVRQVLYNLLSNAVGFSRPGGVIQVTCWREAGWMNFSVEDEGVGIPKPQLKRVFERFESRSQGSGHRGAGLGLSIVQSLVALHGGDVSLDSEPGRGTKVSVQFPERGLQSEAGGTETENAARVVRS